MKSHDRKSRHRGINHNISDAFKVYSGSARLCGEGQSIYRAIWSWGNRVHLLLSHTYLALTMAQQQ